MEQPHSLFLVDGIGAVLSSLSLGLLLPYFAEHLGVPKQILYALAVPAVFFALYSLICYFIKVDKWRQFLKGIAAANLLYCCATIFLVFSQFRELTGWGLTYFVGEVVVILVIVYWELRVAVRERKSEL